MDDAYQCDIKRRFVAKTVIFAMAARTDHFTQSSLDLS